MIPVYVVTGFLDSGKTTFLNHLRDLRDWQNVRILVLQFEAGEEAFSHHDCDHILFSKKDLERQPDQIVRQIHGLIQSRGQEIDEIWIEWNGVAMLSELQSLLLDSSLRRLCKIEKVIHFADAETLENLLGRTGGALPEQIANSDFVILRNASSTNNYKGIRHLLRELNPGVQIFDAKKYQNVYKQLFKKKEPPVNVFLGTVAIIIIIYLFASPVLVSSNIPFNTVVNVFLGIILQAVPFLLIGVLLSSIIQVFIPQSAIERRFPRSLVPGLLFAILGGFCLPVCDCASIPIFKSLVRKGIPLPVAVTFMSAAPVINPVVILSTYYAFGGNLKIVAARVLLGIISASLIGLVFAVRPQKGRILTGGTSGRLLCSCGCWEDAESIATFKEKLGLFFRHSQAEFFSVGKYLVIGTFIASIFQVAGTGLFATMQSGTGLAASIVFMMAMGFALSLCSSSDAVVARSFANQFPMGAIMGFMVFGPMLDIKNVLMLTSGFTKRFIGKLILAAFIVCFAVVFLFSAFGGI